MYAGLLGMLKSSAWTLVCSKSSMTDGQGEVPRQLLEESWLFHQLTGFPKAGIFVFSLHVSAHSIEYRG